MVNDNIAGAFLCNDMDLQIVEERLGIEPCTHRPDGLFRQWLSPHQIKKTRLKNCASTFSTVFFHLTEAQCLSVYDFMSSWSVTYHFY